MQVRVRFLGVLEDFTGCGETRSELPSGAVMEDVMVWIGTQYGLRMPVEIWDRRANRFAAMTVVFLDGEDVEDYSRPVRDGSEVICASMIAGG